AYRGLAGQSEARTGRICGARSTSEKPRAGATAPQGKVRKTMPDDLTNRGPQDRSRISLLEPHEVQYWADKFNVSKERLSEAVRNVGHSADAVERELKRPTQTAPREATRPNLAP